MDREEGCFFGRMPKQFLTLELKGQGHKIIHSKTLRAEIKDRIGQQLLRNQRLQGVAESLPTLAEGSLHNRTEELFITAEGHAGIACQTDHSRLDLRWRIKGSGSHSKQIFNVIPCLKEDGKDAVGLGARFLGDALRNLLLNHADHLRDTVAMLKNLEENLRGNIIREVSDD